MEDPEIMEDLRQCKAWGRYLETQHIKMVDIPAEDGFHVLKGILMPLNMLGLNMLKIQRSEHDPNWKDLTKLKKKHWVVSSIIEPTKVQNADDFKVAGYRLSNFPYLATKTVVVDLRPSKKELWKNMTENAKRLVKKNEKLEIVEVSPEVFLEDWKKWAKIWTMKISELKELKRVLKKKVRFLEGRINGIPHSGLLIVRTSDTANYLHSWTSEAGRESGAHYKLVWEEFLRSKKKRLSFFDFEGIYDSRWPQKKWLGFTEFKKKFGGKEVTFPGCFFRWL